MSQRILKCIICGGDHSIFHCNHKCGVCNGDVRQCSCTTQAPQKKRKGETQRKGAEPSTSASQSSQSSQNASYKELQRLYEKLQKKHEREGESLGNLQQQNQELAGELADKERELEEATADAEELANLVRTRDEAIKTLQNKLADAKKTIAAMKTELETLRRSQTNAPQQQQQQQRGANRVSTHSLAGIHQRYQKVLKIQTENDCSMANAFRLADCPRSTLRDFVAIAELKIVDAGEHDLVIRDLQGKSVKELEAACRKRLRRYIPVLSNMRREGKLLLLKFEDRFYEWSKTKTKRLL